MELRRVLYFSGERTMKKSYDALRDIFALSLGGMTVLTPLTAESAIMHIRLHKRANEGAAVERRASRKGSPDRPWHCRCAAEA